VYESGFGQALATFMGETLSDRRREYFNGFVDDIASARPLPSVVDFGAVVPNSIVSRLDRMYRGLAALDYRQRLADFPAIFDEIERCLFVVRRAEAHDRLTRYRRHAPLQSPVLGSTTLAKETSR
jgi:hypothetical protein